MEQRRVLGNNRTNMQKWVDALINKGWSVAKDEAYMVNNQPVYNVVLTKGIDMKGRTVNDLREVLWKQIEDIQAGNGTPEKANAIISAADSIIDTIKLELTYATILKRGGAVTAPIPALEYDDAIQRPGEAEGSPEEVHEEVEGQQQGDGTGD